MSLLQTIEIWAVIVSAIYGILLAARQGMDVGWWSSASSLFAGSYCFPAFVPHRTKFEFGCLRTWTMAPPWREAFA